MKLTNLRIENYKGLREVDIPLSSFVCLIGENNTGKSSVLQAFSLFFSGSALPKSHYFDPGRDVRVIVSIEDIAQVDIDRLAEEHRTKIQAIVEDGKLILVRSYGDDGKSALRYQKRMPTEDRFSAPRIAELTAGKKPGRAFQEAVVAVFPELTNIVTASMNQTEVKAKITDLADGLPENQKALADVALPTGIDKSVSALLPEPIYIPAVKDLKDDIKTTESTPFGKILGILLKAIEPHLADEQQLFERLNSKLNRVAQPDGTEKDERLPPVKTIEQTVEKFVQDSFKTVKLRITIPPPELKTVLSSALIYANDGVEGLIDSKGDGLRRAIVFAILRSYVELNKAVLVSDQPVTDATMPRHLLLFEEPELYLHPKAQRVLFDALGAFSAKHPVVVTTHSPTFFGPQSTTTFVKMTKKVEPNTAEKPFGAAHPVNLGDTSAKDQFQIICYENNNIAFFADTVALVEGDSDFIVFPHLARVLNPAWDCTHLPVRFARIGGKANIRRYRHFFQRFDTRIYVVADLDFLLGNEFMQIDPSAEIQAKRNQLIASLDLVVEETGVTPNANAEQIKSAHERRDLRALWQEARRMEGEYKAGRIPWEQVAVAVEEFFAWEKYWIRRDALRDCADTDLLRKKVELLDDLRATGVCVLEKGAIEDYYPPRVVGDSKPAKAQSFCNGLTREEALTLCNQGHKAADGTLTSEFEAIFQTILS